jgi:hypothetical protein
MSMNLLGQTALDCVTAQFRAVFTETIDERYVKYSLDAPNSRLQIQALLQGTDGSTGIYENNASCTYAKANLGVLVPYPVVYDGAWPTTYRLLKTYLQSRYGFLLEDGEFTIASNLVTTPLQADDAVNATPNPMTGEVALTAVPASGRWKTGTSLRLVIAASNGPTRLTALVPTSVTPQLAALTDVGDSHTV